MIDLGSFGYKCRNNRIYGITTLFNIFLYRSLVLVPIYVSVFNIEYEPMNCKTVDCLLLHSIYLKIDVLGWLGCMYLVENLLCLSFISYRELLAIIGICL